MKFKYFFLLLLFIILGCTSNDSLYVCPPCDLACDTLLFSKPGICPHCNMKLIKQAELIPQLDLKVNDINIKEGSGKFLIEGGFDKSKTIIIHYHKPQNFTLESKVILVVPGAGRNGGDYRDAWQRQSEKYSLLVLSLEYAEKYYPRFWSYNLGGMIYDVSIQNETFRVNQNADEWIFGDFDRIFNAVKHQLGLSQTNYDMFGHSAGGQILHRFALFNLKNNADRILAANSGWYIIPTNEESFPYGLSNLNLEEKAIEYTSKLTIFLGEKDDANETRGHLRRSPEVDKQGLHRLARGQYFYNNSKRIAEQLNKTFNWNLKIVSGVGHDYQKMSDKAADYLYKTNKHQK